MNKLLSFLGIARNAGAVEPGFEAVKSAILQSRAKLVITASDLSPRTVKELKFICEKKHIPLITITAEIIDISRAIGIKAGCLAVCSEGFADTILSKYSN